MQERLEGVQTASYETLSKKNMKTNNTDIYLQIIHRPVYMSLPLYPSV